MIAIVVGTRPEIIKMAPIIHEAAERGIEFRLVDTSQHYDEELSAVFYRDLDLPEPDYRLGVGSGTHAEQTGKAMMELEGLLLKERPSMVLVEGDTNTVLSGALAAVKLGVPVGHVEAGLRSRDLRMPEEHNRRLTDHISSLLFAPTKVAVGNLVREDVWGKIHLTGNTIIDACMKYLPRALERAQVLKTIHHRQFALSTLHRAENVDAPSVLESSLTIFEGCPLPVVFPAHPRTLRRLEEFGLLKRARACPNLQIVPPVGYMDFLALMDRCSFLLTDSGGIQEEATAPNLQKHVYVLRESTERPEAVETGYAEVVGNDPRHVLRRLEDWGSWRPQRGACPYGDGFAARRILDVIQDSPFAVSSGPSKVRGGAARRTYISQAERHPLDSEA